MEMRKIRGYFYAATIRGSCRIDIGFMIRNKHIVKGEVTQGVLEWTGGDRVVFLCNMKGDNKYLKLSYTITDRKGVKTEYNYRITIDEVDSNLGKGKLLYFLCPESSRRARILISAYGEGKFIHREHYEVKYGLRVYYGCQKTSKADYYNTRYFDLKSKVDSLEVELNKKHRKSHYRGKLTREHKILLKLKREMQTLNQKRLQVFQSQFEARYGWLG